MPLGKLLRPPNGRAVKRRPSSSEYKDFLGLQTLWPKDTAEEETRVDLVAVHGLAGGSLSAWTHDNGHNWLVEFLPHYFEDVRVLAFGYRARDAYIAGEYSDANSRVTTFAEELCNDLRDARRDQHRPLVFIGHGVGGIVIKAALSYAKARETLYGSLVSSTSHAVFFDTPHNGFYTNTWSAIVGDKVSTHSHEQFGAWSQALNDLGRMFAGIGPHLHITSYLASVPVSGGMCIVPETSAILGYENEATLRLDSVNHITMCKYEDQDNGSFQRVKNRLKAYIGEILSPQVFFNAKTLNSSSDTIPHTDIHEGSGTNNERVLNSKNLGSGEEWLPQSVELPLAVNPRFSGRVQELAQLKRLLSSTRDEQSPHTRATRVAVHGLGGVGKTQLVNQYVHQVVQNSRTSVFWLTANTTAELGVQFAQLASSIRGEASDSEMVQRLVRRYRGPDQSKSLVLGWMSLHEDFILVLDNFDDITIDIQSYLPAHGRGRILFTTRDRNVVGSSADYGLALTWTNGSDSEELFLRLQGMSAEEVFNIGAHPEYETIVKIVRELDGFPLALSQAAAFIRSNGPMKFSEYLELLQPKSVDREKLLRFKEVNPDYPESVMTTWEISLGFLLQQSPEAKMILEILGFLSPFKIYESMLNAAVRSAAWHFGTFRGLRELSQHQKEQLSFLGKGVSFRKAIGKLVSLSLIDRNPEGHRSAGATLSVHPLVHEWIRTRLNTKPKERSHLAWLAGLVVYQASHITSPEALEFDPTCMLVHEKVSCDIKSHVLDVVENIFSDETSSGPDMPLECATLILCLLLQSLRQRRRRSGLIEGIMESAHFEESRGLRALQTGLCRALHQFPIWRDRGVLDPALQAIAASIDESHCDSPKKHSEVIFLMVYILTVQEIANRAPSGLHAMESRDGKLAKRTPTKLHAARVLQKLLYLLTLVPSDRAETKFLQLSVGNSLAGFVSTNDYWKSYGHLMTDILHPEFFKYAPFSLTAQFLERVVGYQSRGQRIGEIKDVLATILLATELCMDAAAEAEDKIHIKMSSSRYISSSFGRYNKQIEDRNDQLATKMEGIWEAILPAADVALRLLNEVQTPSDRVEVLMVFGSIYRIWENIIEMNAFRSGIAQFRSFKEADVHSQLIRMFFATGSWASALNSLYEYFPSELIMQEFLKEDMAFWFRYIKKFLAPDVVLPSCSLFYRAHRNKVSDDDPGESAEVDPTEELHTSSVTHFSEPGPSGFSTAGMEGRNWKPKFVERYERFCVDFPRVLLDPSVLLLIWLQTLEKLHRLFGNTTTCTPARLQAWKSVVDIICCEFKNEKCLMFFESLALINELATATDEIRMSPLYFSGSFNTLEDMQQKEFEDWGIVVMKTKGLEGGDLFDETEHDEYGSEMEHDEYGSDDACLQFDLADIDEHSRTRTRLLGQ